MKLETLHREYVNHKNEDVMYTAAKLTIAEDTIYKYSRNSESQYFEYKNEKGFLSALKKAYTNGAKRHPSHYYDEILTLTI